MSLVTLRPALESDSERLVELNRQLGYPTSLDLLARRVKRILASEQDCLLVASLPDGHLAGWIHAQLSQWLESEYRAEIGGLVVDQSVRRQGVGRTLVAGVAHWAADHGAVELSVRCQVHRADAHAFYVAQGFTLTKSQHVFRRSILHG